MCFAWISEQIAIFPLYSINLSVFIAEAECLLRGTNWVFKLYRYSFVLKGLIKRHETHLVFFNSTSCTGKVERMKTADTFLRPIFGNTRTYTHLEYTYPRILLTLGNKTPQKSENRIFVRLQVTGANRTLLNEEFHNRIVL